MRIVLRMLEPLPRCRWRSLDAAIRVAVGVPAYLGALFAPGVFIIGLLTIPSALRLSRTEQIVGVAIGELLIMPLLCLLALRIWRRWRALHELVLDDVVLTCGVALWAAVAPLFIGHWGYA